MKGVFRPLLYIIYRYKPHFSNNYKKSSWETKIINYINKNYGDDKEKQRKLDLLNYQVNEMVKNFISLDSYINTMIILCLLIGCLFELPVLCWLLANIGILQAQIMQHYRKHAIVIILIVATVITPTADIFTLLRFRKLYFNI